MDAYASGEQSPDARRETARLIDGDDSVYASYRHAKQDDSALRGDLAPLGTPERAQLERSFAAIGAALNTRSPLSRLNIRGMIDWRATLAAFFLAALTLLPVAYSVNRVAAIGIATQPKPHIALIDGITPTGETPVIAPDTTLTPQLATAQFVTRATPTAPESE